MTDDDGKVSSEEGDTSVIPDGREAYEAATAEVARRVEEGRRSGKYPPELDAQLESEFARMPRDPLWFRAFDRIPPAVAAVRAVRFGQRFIESTSSLPGGAVLHQTVGRLVTRQVGGLAEQMSRFATEVAAALDAMAAALDETRKWSATTCWATSTRCTTGSPPSNNG
ncbi:MAG: hypothetical protein R2698_01945 [Microthrixaceae bacterium]